MVIHYESELYHHGVPGMKWGHRKAKQDYKAAKRKAFKKYDEKITNIDDKYDFSDFEKGGKGYSPKDKAAMDKAHSDYKKEVAKAKDDYKKAKAEAKAEKKEYKQDLNAYRRYRDSTLIDVNEETGEVSMLNMGALTRNGFEAKRGKEYADHIVNKVNKERKVATIASATVTAGLIAVPMILQALANKSAKGR